MNSAELIELVKATAWPVVVGWGLWYFREPLLSLLPRVTKVGPVSIEPSARQQENLPVTSGISESIAKIKAIVPNELLDEVVHLIEKNIPADARATPESTKNYLTHIAAALQVIGTFERIYSFIFGSQIFLLKLINTAPQSIDAARAAYQSAVAANEIFYTGVTFEKWFAFLTHNLLAAPVQGNSAMFEITPRGRGLLRFITDNGYAEYKPF